VSSGHGWYGGRIVAAGEPWNIYGFSAGTPEVTVA
jgi:hypothetical protein